MESMLENIRTYHLAIISVRNIKCNFIRMNQNAFTKSGLNNVRDTNFLYDNARLLSNQNKKE